MTVAESAKASYEYILDSVMDKLADKGGGRGFRKARDEGEWKRSISAMVEMDIADACRECNFRRHRSGSIMAFDGKIFVPMMKEDLMRLCMDLCRINGLSELYMTDTSERFYRTIVKNVTHEIFNPKRNFITFDNCVLDTETMETFDFSPMIESCIRININYDPLARSPLWEKFLDDVIPVKDTQDALQEFVGCAFVDRKKIKMEKMCYLLGCGSNGKSVFFDAVVNALGKDNVSYMEMADLSGDKSTCEYNIAMINGKLLNYASEMGGKDVSGGKYKKFISGEPTMARLPFGEPFLADMMPPFMANLNKMPSVSDQTYGHFRRSLVIPFYRVFKESEQDRSLPLKLSKESAAIINWIIEGARRFVKNKGEFTRSYTIESVTENARRDSNSVLSYLYDSGYDSSGDIEESAIRDRDLYVKYIAYCNDCGVRPYSKRKMVDMIRQEGYSVTSAWDENRNRLFQVVLRRKYNPDEYLLQQADDIMKEDLPF